VREAHWPDASLGCPQKGQVYAQELTAGYSIQLEVDGASHQVHVGSGRAVRCDREHASAPPRYFEVVAQVQSLARRALADRLKVDARDVKVVRVRPMTWPDASLGCPEPKQVYEKIETKGFFVELEHAGKSYVYHADPQRVVFCAR